MTGQDLSGMRSAAPFPRAGEAVLSAEPEAGVPLNVVLMYEDPPAARRALQIVSSLISTCGLELKLNVWRIDLLEDAIFRELAGVQAKAADIIIVSTARMKKLPEPVDRWVDACLSRRHGDPGAVMAYLGPENSWALSLPAEEEDEKGLLAAGRPPAG